MRKRLILLPLLLLTATLLISCSGSKSESWNLVWQEDFSGPVLKEDEWRVTVQGENYNNEDQAYINDLDNLQVKEGSLILTCIKEPWTGVSNRNGSTAVVTQQYTSAEVNSKRSWTYGRFEIRAKAANTIGILSALWMTPLDGDWPPEIDIMEVLGNSANTAYFTHHYGGTGEAHKQNGGHYDSSNDLSADYHIYTVEWEAKSIRWYVDGALLFTSTVDEGIPSEPFILRFSLPVGPDWTRNPTPASKFPQSFYIDWVKVYQRC
ncbi:MAG TPA: glycoside hydrolase family 16 protein [Bacillota bacterium]|nr:glycoside hydrolase family 16 protein [Bacillota bacterium]